MVADRPPRPEHSEEVTMPKKAEPERERDRRTQINVILEPALDARLREYVERTGFSIKHVIERAIRRDLDSPPVITVPPLPEAPPEPAPKPAGRPGRKRV